MSLNWPDKDPDELLDFTVDWSRFFTDDTISTVTWYCNNSSGTKTAFGEGVTVNALVNSDVANTTTTATIYLGGGTVNTIYTIYCQVETAAGLIAERSIKLRIRQK